jgi:hypothetical protein
MGNAKHPPPWPRKFLASRLDPEAALKARRYEFLRMELNDAHRWLGEFYQIECFINWLRERDTDHWRRLDEKPVGKLPPDISGFREFLRKERDARSIAPAPAEPFAYCCSSFDIAACDCVNKDHGMARRG